MGCGRAYVPHTKFPGYTSLLTLENRGTHNTRSPTATAAGSKLNTVEPVVIGTETHTWYIRLRL